MLGRIAVNLSPTRSPFVARGFMPRPTCAKPLKSTTLPNTRTASVDRSVKIVDYEKTSARVARMKALKQSDAVALAKFRENLDKLKRMLIDEEKRQVDRKLIRFLETINPAIAPITVVLTCTILRATGLW